MRCRWQLFLGTELASRADQMFDLLQEKKMNVIPTVQMDRTVLSVVSLHDAPDEQAHWLGKTPLERLEAVELLRQLNYGYDPTTARLQNVFGVDDLRDR